MAGSPSILSSTLPSLKSTIVGSAVTLKREASAGYFSVSTLTTCNVSLTGGEALSAELSAHSALSAQRAESFASLGSQHAPAHSRLHLLQDGSQQAARSTPLCVEVHQHRNRRASKQVVETGETLLLRRADACATHARRPDGQQATRPRCGRESTSRRGAGRRWTACALLSKRGRAQG